MLVSSKGSLPPKKQPSQQASSFPEKGTLHSIDEGFMKKKKNICRFGVYWNCCLLGKTHVWVEALILNIWLICGGQPGRVCRHEMLWLGRLVSGLLEKKVMKEAQMPSCKTRELSPQVNGAAFVQLAGAPFLSRMCRPLGWTGNFSIFFWVDSAMCLYQMTKNRPGGKCVEVEEVIEDPLRTKFRLLLVWYWLYHLTRFYPSSRYQNKALWNYSHHALSLAWCPLTAWSVL